MGVPEKPLVWLHGQIKTPPFSREARLEAGFLLRRLQQGAVPAMPHARKMPSIGPRCWELRIRDAQQNWRIFYRIDTDGVVILAVHDKKSERALQQVLNVCRQRLGRYKEAAGRKR
ncbi:MAG: type II toxin-antitoxin system RelE/ParE family toxin [Myxococcota bacterium]